MLPSPDGDDGDDGDDVDLGDLDPDDAPSGWRAAGNSDRVTFTPGVGPGDWTVTTEAVPDPKPAPVSKTGRGPKAKPGKISKATRDDIEGKLGLMLEIPGRIWEARDPLCGGAFVAQAPAIRSAAVELILLSPDLVAWFTGVGGGFMLWLNLLMACQPVAVMVWAHHVAHSVELPEGQAGPGARQYAA